MHFDQSEDDARISSLHALAILDTPPEERFDRLTRLASWSFGAPMALVSLVDRERQWFKSRVGLDVDETRLPEGFCSLAVRQRRMLVVTDAAADARFCASALVTGAPHIRFYAGQPIFTRDGAAVGTLCILDTAPRDMSEAERAHFADLASLVQDELNKYALLDAKTAAEHALQELNGQLEKRIDERTRSMRETNEALKREIRQREAVEATLRRSEGRISAFIESCFSAFVSVDAAGAVVDWNDSAEQTFGWTRAEVAGRELADVIFPAHRRVPLDALMRRYLAAGDDSAVNQRARLLAVTRLGDEIAVEMTVSAYGSDEGLFFGVFLHDVSARERADFALEQKRELINAVLETIDVGVVAASADGELTLFNRSAREFHGLAAESIHPGQWPAPSALYAADGRTMLDPQDVPLFRALQGETIKDLPIMVAPKGMRQRLLLASGRPLTGAGGDRIGAVVALKDITELNESQRRLRLNEHRLRAITDNLPALIGQVDQNGRFVFLNSQAARYFRKPIEQLLGKHVSVAYTSADFARIAPYVEQAMGGQRASFEDEVELGGRRFYYSATYIPDTDASGEVHGFYAMAFDITFRKNSEIAQRESEERLRTITDNLPVLISYKDRDMRFRFANSLYRNWFGAGDDQVIGRTALEVYGEENHAERAAHFERCLQGQTVEFDLPVTIHGRARRLHTVLVPHMRDGLALGAYALTTDVTRTRRHEAQLKRLADTDSLTGLPNRRSYESALSSAVTRAAAAAEPMALLYLDIDHFKGINDTLGHAAGDEVLRELAQRLRRAVRKGDLVCRLAGDEFTVVLEGLRGPGQCERVAGKILAAMAPAFIVGGEPLAVSVSIGVAWDPGASVDAAALGYWADSALYQAKDGGRDRYVLVETRA